MAATSSWRRSPPTARRFRASARRDLGPLRRHGAAAQAGIERGGAVIAGDHPQPERGHAAGRETGSGGVEQLPPQALPNAVGMHIQRPDLAPRAQPAQRVIPRRSGADEAPDPARELGHVMGAVGALAQHRAPAGNLSRQRHLRQQRLGDQAGLGRPPRATCTAAIPAASPGTALRITAPAPPPCPRPAGRLRGRSRSRPSGRHSRFPRPRPRRRSAPCRRHRSSDSPASRHRERR